MHRKAQIIEGLQEADTVADLLKEKNLTVAATFMCITVAKQQRSTAQALHKLSQTQLQQHVHLTKQEQ